MHNINEYLFDKLNLYEKGKLSNETKEIFSSIREELGDQTLFSRANLYNYRKNNKLPNSFLAGAILANKLREANKKDISFYESVFNFYFEIFGLSFGEVEYNVFIKEGDTSSFLDIETYTRYSDPKLYEGVTTTSFHISNHSEVYDPGSNSTRVSISGDGIKKSGELQETHIIHKNNDGEKLFEEYRTSRDFLFSDACDFNSSLTIFRSIQNVLRTVRDENQKSGIEQFGIIVRRPVRKLKLRAIFDRNLVPVINKLNISVNCWGSESSFPENFDYAKMSSNIIGESRPTRVSESELLWESSMPVVPGLRYGLTYQVDEFASIKRMLE